MPPQPPTGTDEDTLDDAEEVTAEPVLDGREPVAHPVSRRPGNAPARPAGRARTLATAGAGSVVVQAAAVAATGLVAGAATTALVRAAQGRRSGTRAPRARGGRDGVEVLETRTFVVDVHLLGRR